MTVECPYCGFLNPHVLRGSAFMCGDKTCEKRIYALPLPQKAAAAVKAEAATGFDPVNRPAHYHRSEIEPIDAIEAWGLGFCLGNAVKYISRAGHKGSRLEDLRKAAWYLAREIQNEERKESEKR
jgi:hypothetical protein